MDRTNRMRHFRGHFLAKMEKVMALNHFGDIQWGLLPLKADIP